LVSGYDWCSFLFVKVVEVLFDVACVEFHAGEILHLVRDKEIEVGGAGGTGIKNQDTPLSESWFDLLVGDLK